MKNIYTIAPDIPFLETLAQEIWRQADGDMFRLSRSLILLPTRRACRHLGNVFAKLANGKPVLLPRMRPLGESDEDEFTFADTENFTIPPAIGSLKRLMLLTQQVQRRDPTLSWDQALPAAEALAAFLDQIQIEQCDVSKLPELVEEQELAEHWQQTIQFLDIVTRNWPLILAEQGCVDAAERRNLVLNAQAEIWRTNPPDYPVIAAGSTGSVPATAGLLDVIASLPQGAVILPGLDQLIDNEGWEKSEDTSPQNAMKNLLHKMGVRREAVQNFGAAPLSTPRAKLISEAMRPATSTEAWRELRGAFDKTCVAGLTLVTLDHQQEEAQVIALRLREFLETPEQTAALVTADRGLAVRVASLLRRWGIDGDDSGGAPISFSTLGAFLGLVLDAAAPKAGVIDALALLKHSLAACGQDPVDCRNATRDAEMRARNLEDENFDILKNILKSVTQNYRHKMPLADHIAAHIAAAEEVAATDTEKGADRLWQDEAGENIAAWLDEWREASHGFPPLTGADYAALFETLASRKILRSGRATHPRLVILGPLEARLIEADLVILGGMNEGTWPPDAGFDPWMSRQMRAKFKLPSPEFRIGLAAHDFAQLACHKQVMLTRSARSKGNPSVPSRFLLQLDAVLRAVGLSDEHHDALEPTTPWRVWAHGLDVPDSITPCDRPQPRPPAAIRPTTLSVTEITVWMRNPYAIYAKHILKLKKLEELDAELDASDRGMMIHESLEKFTRAFPTILPDDAEAQLLKIGEGIFAHDKGNPRIRAFWWARFVDIAQWFVNHERARRTNGTRLLAAEPKGAITLHGLTLKGRADRIDRLADGSLSITDYKTGSVPKEADVKSGIEPQLPLLAMMANASGFDKITGVSGALEYWILKGGRSGCDVDVYDTEIADLIAQAEMGLKELIEKFANAATPYEAAPKPRYQPRYNDYAHLSRLAEWGRTVDDT